MGFQAAVAASQSAAAHAERWGWLRVATIVAATVSGSLAWSLPALGGQAAQTRSPYVPSAQPAAPPVPASTADLAAVRRQIQAGDFETAREALSRFEPGLEVLRLKVDAAVGAGQFDDATADYARLAALDGKEDPARLGAIASGVTGAILHQGDRLLAIEACDGLLSYGDRACAAELERDADEAKEPMAMRIASLGVLARHGIAGAARKLAQLAATVKGPPYRAVIEAAAGLPPDVAEPLLRAGLDVADEGAQYAAANALGAVRTPGARMALERYLAGAPAPSPRGAARLSLARLGDQSWLDQFVAVLPQLDGDVLLAVGEMLRSRGDARGLAAIRRAARSDHELLRLSAAARLPAGDEAAGEILDTALASADPWTRVAALQAFRDSSLLPLSRAREFLSDREPWVRVRAAQAIFVRLDGRTSSASSVP